jgi:hypothetical protein
VLPVVSTDSVSHAWGAGYTFRRWAACAGKTLCSAWNGEPFELIGVNLDEYDNEGRISYEIVDWPYDSAHVLARGSEVTKASSCRTLRGGR